MHKITLSGRVETAQVTGGAIVMDVVTQYGTISIPVRGWRFNELETLPTLLKESGEFLDIDIDIHLPDWIVS